MTTAAEVLDAARKAKLMIVTAESCTGGLIAGALTEVPGSSDVVWGGFVTYANDAKIALGVEPEYIAEHGAVSEEVAVRMAEQALERSGADVSVAVTGVAGPGGGSAAKPVGLVHFAAARKDGDEVIVHIERYGDIGRSEVRGKTVETALALLYDAITGE
jgi:nicotinamide-nucleotide amidase